MKRSNFLYGFITAAIMLLLPFLAVTLFKGDGGMAVCFLLFYAVDPIWSVVIGFFAGRSMKTSWFQPLLSPILFLAGVWLFFDMGEPAFLLYAAVYLAIGVLTMLAVYLITAKKR